MSQVKSSPEAARTLSLHLGTSQEQQGNLCPELGLAPPPCPDLVAAGGIPGTGTGLQEVTDTGLALAQLPALSPVAAALAGVGAAPTPDPERSWEAAAVNLHSLLETPRRASAACFHHELL